MKKLMLYGLFFFIIGLSFGQNVKKITGTIYAQANITVYDRYVKLNSSGPGVGLQLYYNASKKIKPYCDITGNMFGGVKVLLLFEDGTIVPSKEFVLTSFAGIIYSPNAHIELGAVAGPSFWGNVMHWGVKPSISFYLNKKKSFKANAALTHIYQWDRESSKGFGFVSAGLGIKLF